MSDLSIIRLTPLGPYGPAFVQETVLLIHNNNLEIHYCGTLTPSSVHKYVEERVGGRDTHTMEFYNQQACTCQTRRIAEA